MTSFRELHVPGDPVVMPNPWDVGSAVLFESLGFKALATTSSGHAYTLARPDGRHAVSRDEAIEHGGALAAAVSVPVNGDLERGYADDPEGVAETVRRAAGAGLAGCSIEDSTGVDDQPIYDLELSIARVAAAVEAARSLDADFVVTARAENYLHGRRNLADTVARLQAFQEAGADVLYAPGIIDVDEMATLVSEVDRPVNALARPHWTVGELAGAGVARISIGGALAVTAMAAAVEGAREILDRGTFTYTQSIPGGFDLDEVFGG